MTMLTFRSFSSVQEARDYRHEHGTGGWIFAADDAPADRHYSVPSVVLFPPEMAPTSILGHPLTRGLSGRLIGC